MDRITKRIDDTHACYAICEKECPDGIYADNPACMCAASKMAMKRLLEYEATGLTPPEIMELKERDTAKAPVPFPVDAERRLCRGIGFAQSADRDSGRRTDMQLEKILEELGEYICDDLCYYRETSVDENDGEMEEICAGCKVGGYLKAIRKHMNDGWIPVEERLPKENGDDGELIVTDKDGRIWSGIYYGITEETDEYPCFHKWDEEMWYCYKPDVIAWRHLPEPYHLEPETEKPDWRQDMLRKFDRRE